MSTYQCVCQYERGSHQQVHICLEHLRLLQIIDLARPIMDGIADCDPAVREWIRRAAELPRSAEFPLPQVAAKAKGAARSTPTKTCTHRWTVDGLRNPRPDDKCDGCGETWANVQAGLTKGSAL